MDVDENVEAVDDKLVAVIDGAQYTFNQLAQLLMRLVNEKAGRVLIQQTANDVLDQVKSSRSLNCIHAGHAGSITGNQLRQDLRRWLSPPDPSTDHHIACNAHHKGTATWFFEGRAYKECKSTGSESILWIHGKRVPLSPQCLSYSITCIVPGPSNLTNHHPRCVCSVAEVWFHISAYAGWYQIHDDTTTCGSRRIIPSCQDP